jgi:homoserine O-acetyltransferase
MDLHDVARGRGSRRRALERVACPVLVSSVRSDGLYPPVQQRALAEEFRAVGTPVEHVDIDSPHGHDAFLIETQLLGPAVARFLEEDHD